MKNDKKRKKTAYSHGGKLGVNVLSNISSLPFHVIVFRAVWIVKNLHSTFDYIFNSMHKYDSCAHALAVWLKTINSKYQGGYTPNFESIKTEPDKAEMFLKFLFLKQKYYVDEKVLKLLLASILIFYQELEEFLDKEPKKSKKVRINGKCFFMK